MIPHALLLPLTALLAQDGSQASESPRHMAVVEVGPRQVRRLTALDLDVARLDLVAGRAEVIVDEADIAALERSGLPFEVTIRDLAAFYARRLAEGPHSPAAGSYGAWLSPPFASGSMGGYYTLAQVESVLDQMRAAYPNLVSARASIGTSIEGRSLWTVRISDNPDVDEGEPEVRIDALHHAREPQGMQCALWFMLYLLESYGSDPLATYLVDEREIYFVPCVNPDGYEYNRITNPGGGGLWRKNRRNNGGGSFGVDLNRNYVYKWGYDNSGSSSDPNSETYRGTGPGSEPEVSAMQAFITGHSFNTAISLHTYSNLWLSPYGYDALYPTNWDQFLEVGTLATEVNGYPHGPASLILYLANGVTVDYDHAVHGSLSWTPEIGGSNDGFWPPQSRIVPLAEENLLALVRSALAGGAWVRLGQLSIVDAGDGDGSFEQGEPVDFSAALRNSGMLDSGSVDLTLASSSPWATIVTGSAGAGSVPSFGDGTNGTPLRLSILPGTPSGTSIPFTVAVTYDGWTQEYEGSIVVGKIVTVAAFDFEAAGSEGWGLGSPNDASTGNWVRVDPNGTPAQPEDDHTDPPGVLCWVTGQGSVGGGVGDNDVDNGSTTLLSPVFDLSSGFLPKVRYWRWYSNDEGGDPNNDVFQVDLSNDGGSSWVSAEVVGPAGPETSGGWFEVELDVAAILAPTSQMRLRFIASDLSSGSIVEAAVDDVLITYVEDGGCATAKFCNPSTGSTNNTATIDASACSLAGSVVLSLANGPASQFTYLLIGDGTTIVSQPPGSIGDLCLAGGSCLGRYAKDIGQTTASGTFALDISSSISGGPGFGIPTCGGNIQSGETWNFQFWHRNPMGAPSSFSEAIGVTFQ